MSAERPYRFKIASEESEFDEIHRLNYRTFVEEIPQHPVNTERRLVDAFDTQNTYAICLQGDHLVGMISVQGRRPFSLDAKLDDLDSYLPAGRKVCEFRLLSVDPGHRNGTVFLGLMRLMARHCFTRGYDTAVISGTTRQLRLYRHLGFVPFGPLVGAREAPFQPMYLTQEAFLSSCRDLLAPASEPSHSSVNLLPGPVSIRKEVREALATPPASHRSESFVLEFQVTKRRLCRFVGARNVEILVGTGTLANDAVAGQLSLLEGPGLVLANGEFGERLADHAGRFGLDFDVLRRDWGAVFERHAVEAAIDRSQGLKWLWAVHCETSTGVLNDLSMLQAVTGARNIHLCLDAISSIGTLPVDLAPVYLASSVSGKGLGAFPGLSMVFYNHEIAPAKLPRYLDLGSYASNEGIPFTHSSNLHAALAKALDRFDSGDYFKDLSQFSSSLRDGLRALGFQIVAPDQHASPAVITIVLPDSVSSEVVGEQLESSGYLLSYRSEYLLRRNWIQICLMGELEREKLPALLPVLAQVLSSGRSVPAKQAAGLPC